MTKKSIDIFEEVVEIVVVVIVVVVVAIVVVVVVVVIVEVIVVVVVAKIFADCISASAFIVLVLNRFFEWYNFQPIAKRIDRVSYS